MKSNEALLVVSEKRSFQELMSLSVTYQESEFYWLGKLTKVIFGNLGFGTQDELEKTLEVKVRAIIFFDERSLIMSGFFKRFIPNPLVPIIFVTHDFWAHPLMVCRYLRQIRTKLIIVRHLSAKRLYSRFMPDTEIIVKRPGFEDNIFYPRDAQKEYDIILSGTHSEDYPLRNRLYQLVINRKESMGWKVLDVTNQSNYSNPISNQMQYAPLLSAAKVCVTGSVRTNIKARILSQYFDGSTARRSMDSVDQFYGTTIKDIDDIEITMAGIPPRYMEAFACNTALAADLPSEDFQDFYADKMIRLESSMSDDAIIELLKFWIDRDAERTELTQYAYRAVAPRESSKSKATELLELLEERINSWNA